MTHFTTRRSLPAACSESEKLMKRATTNEQRKIFTAGLDVTTGRWIDTCNDKRMFYYGDVEVDDNNNNNDDNDDNRDDKYRHK
jgi:hypothetical protein